MADFGNIPNDGQEKYEETIAFHERALKRELSLRRDNHPKVAVSYSNLGSAYYEQEKYEQAIDFHEKALNIFQNHT